MKYSDHLRYIERGEKEMNRGHVLQSLLPVQQMNMAGNPNWWNINNNIKAPNQEHQPSTFLPSSTSSLVIPHYLPSSPSLPLNTTWNDNQDLPESWSQLLLGGIVGEEDRSGANQFQAKKMQNWEDHQVMYTPSSTIPASVDVKNEISESDYVYCHGSEEFQATRQNWSNIMAVSSPKSCVTTFGSNNMLDFSNNKGDGRNPQPEHSSESYNTSTGGAIKKARIQSSSAPTTFKVRKEKLGDRITALHQLVSPFGKTDTASVLLEAIGYIRFLHNQIEALSTPYLGNASGNMRQQQLQSVQGEKSCRFPEGPGQLLTKNCMKRKGAPDQVLEIEPKKDLKSRGLCLVPVSCTLHVGSNNGADYWAP